MRRILCRTTHSLTALPHLQRVRARNIFIPITTDVPDQSNNRECTLYIKGFLAKGESPENFKDWKKGHKNLSLSHNWGPIAQGYFWKSGDLLGSLVPHATILSGAYQLLALKKLSLTPQMLAITAAAEAVVMGGKFWYEFKKAAETAKLHAPNLALHLQEVSKQFPYVRIVAHSLGCLLTLEALKLLPEHMKPDEIHFLAPVISEDSLVHNVAKEHAYIYHCGTDFALQTASALFFEQKQMVGLTGPAKKWKGLASVDVSNHFGFFVHTNYRHVLDKIIINHKKFVLNQSVAIDLEPIVLHKEESIAEADLIWNENIEENRLLANLESEIVKLEMADEADRLAEMETILKEKQMAESEAVVNSEKLAEEGERDKPNVLNKKELVDVGKEFLQGIKVLLDNRKQLFDHAKALASVAIESTNKLRKL